MTKIDWEKDRRRQLGAQARRDAYLSEVYMQIASGMYPPKPQVKRRRKSSKKLSQAAMTPKLIAAKVRQVLPPKLTPKNRTISKREQELEARRIQFRADRAAGINHFPVRARARKFIVEYR